MLGVDSYKSITMKNINFKLDQIDGEELTRAQLKHVNGGTGDYGCYSSCFDECVSECTSIPGNPGATECINACADSCGAACGF